MRCTAAPLLPPPVTCSGQPDAVSRSSVCRLRMSPLLSHSLNTARVATLATTGLVHASEHACPVRSSNQRRRFTSAQLQQLERVNLWDVELYQHAIGLAARRTADAGAKAASSADDRKGTMTADGRGSSVDARARELMMEGSAESSAEVLVSHACGASVIDDLFSAEDGTHHARAFKAAILRSQTPQSCRQQQLCSCHVPHGQLASMIHGQAHCLLAAVPCKEELDPAPMPYPSRATIASATATSATVGARRHLTRPPLELAPSAGGGVRVHSRVGGSRGRVPFTPGLVP
jgi:hypothetical protein